MAFASSKVPFHHMDREWDCRFNVPTQEDLDLVLQGVKDEVNKNRLSYALVSGVEIGTRPFQDDYLMRHVHVCLKYINRVSKSSVVKNLNIKQGNGYYLVPRKRELPYKGWRDHALKVDTKVDPEELCLFEHGTLPPDVVKATEFVTRSENEKKRKLDDILIEMKDDLKNGVDDEVIFRKFPRNFLTYGEKLKSMMEQVKDDRNKSGVPHLWIVGAPGDGKSAWVQLLFEKLYFKNMDTRFFDLLKKETHQAIVLSDVDHATVEKLGVQFFKTVCDEAGFPVDQKYKTPQLVSLPIIVTSNFRLRDVLPEDMQGRSENIRALERRFFQVNIQDVLRLTDIKLLSKYELNMLKKEGNSDPRKCFMTYDYIRDCPKGEPLPDHEFFQEKIKKAFYGE
nr:MAG: replication protein [Parvo-like hybrid virus UC4]QJI53845.1 MAG: replication protein [Parvo-like hybrid virus UC4]